MKKISLFLRILIFLPFLGICLFFLNGNIQTAKQQNKASLYIPVDARVLESRVRKIVTSRRILYEPYIEYRYTVEGQTYNSTRLGYGSKPIPEGYDGTVKSYVAVYPAGKNITAYYNPENPSESVLTNQESSPILLNVFLITLLGFFFLLIMGPGISEIINS